MKIQDCCNTRTTIGILTIPGFEVKFCRYCGTVKDIKTTKGER